MDNASRHRVTVFAWFTYDIAGTFKHEALYTVQRHRQGWKVCRDAVPVANIIEVLYGFRTELIIRGMASKQAQEACT